MRKTLRNGQNMMRLSRGLIFFIAIFSIGVIMKQTSVVNGISGKMWFSLRKSKSLRNAQQRRHLNSSGSSKTLSTEWSLQNNFNDKKKKTKTCPSHQPNSAIKAYTLKNDYFLCLCICVMLFVEP